MNSTETVGITRFEGDTATVGNITITPYVTPYQSPYVPPTNYDYNTTIWYGGYSYPFYCSGNLHVFGCDHAEKCKCGKAKRKVEPPKCAHCGKAHAQ